MTAKCLLDGKEALEGLNADKMIETYASEFLFEAPSSNDRITDLTALKKYYEQLFSLPEVSFSEIRILEAALFATIEWTWGGVSPITGEQYRVRGVSVIELSGGKVIRESLYFDPKPFWSRE